MLKDRHTKEARINEITLIMRAKEILDMNRNMPLHKMELGSSSSSSPFVLRIVPWLWHTHVLLVGNLLQFCFSHDWSTFTHPSFHQFHFFHTFHICCFMIHHVFESITNLAPLMLKIFGVRNQPFPFRNYVRSQWEIIITHEDHHSQQIITITSFLLFPCIICKSAWPELMQLCHCDL